MELIGFLFRGRLIWSGGRFRDVFRSSLIQDNAVRADLLEGCFFWQAIMFMV